MEEIEFLLLSDPQSSVIEQLGIINTTRKKGTLRHRVAYPLTILINSDRTVAGVVKGDTKKMLHNSQQLIDAWNPLKPEKPKEKQMSFIKVLENQFVDEDHMPIVFKGLAIADPDKIVRDSQWSKKHFEVIKSWGVNLIRIPVHPPRMRKRGLENYMKLLDQAVKWCNELKIYVIIDWHSIGNLRTEKFEAKQYKTSMEETLEFWEAISKRFAGNPTVAFYEIFNEPTTSHGKLGECTWAEWKEIVENIIDVIYANDENTIPLVGGFDWGYDLRAVKSNPIDRRNVAYVAHPYPGKSKPPREAHWEEHFGFVTSRYPVFVTEMGYCLEGHYVFVDEDATYRNAILKFLDKKKISWCAWAFDPHWEPALIKNYKYEPTHSGEFFRDAMLGK